MGKIEGKKKEQGRKLPQIKGRQRCLKGKWKDEKEESQKRRRIEEGVPEKKKNQGMAGMENRRDEKVGVGQNNKVAMD